MMVALVVWATWPTVRYGASRVANFGDSLEAVWIFGWGAHALAHAPLQLFDANIFFPEPLTLAYSENVLGVSLLAAPLFWVTGNAILGYTVAMTMVLAGGGFAVYHLVVRLGGERWPAAVAGAAFAVAPYRVAAAQDHPHVVAIYLLPLILVLLVDLRERPSSRAACRLGVAVALQWWSSLTGGVFALLTAGVWALWELGRRRRRAAPALAAAAAGVTLGLVLSIPVLAPYAQVRRSHPDFGHDQAAALFYSAQPASYLSPALPAGPGLGAVTQRLSRRFPDVTTAGERRLLPGLWLTVAFAGSLGVFAFALARRDGGARWLEPAGLLLALGITGFVVSLGPRWGGDPGGFPLPFALMTRLVPGSLLRVPARAAVLVFLAMAASAGLALSRAPRQVRTAIVAVSLVVLLLEQPPSRLRGLPAPAITSAHRDLAGRPGAVLALPTAEVGGAGIIPATWVRENIHLYLSTAHFRPLTNGYGAFTPGTYVATVQAAASFPSESSFRALHRLGVTTVVVQTAFLAGTPWAGVVEQLRRWPGCRIVARDRGVVVFDVRHATNRTPAESAGRKR